MGVQRSGSKSKSRYRNLNQYKSMSDADFDNMWEEKYERPEIENDFEERIKSKIDEFADDYDLEDMKVNDKLTLRALAQAYITLEDYEKEFYALRTKSGIDLNMVAEYKSISDAMSTIRTDITRLQNDLGITRKARKGDKETSVVNEMERLKLAAKEFYEQKMNYVFCPKCKMLLGTVWFHYPNDKHNKLQFVCHRKLDNNEECGEKVQVSSTELINSKGTNITDVPDYFR